jgi:glycyl-tRNA synthetase
MSELQGKERFETIVSLLKRRGFVYPSSEIYGGLSGVYDYGHYGTLFFNNVRNAWQKSMVQEREEPEKSRRPLC